MSGGGDADQGDDKHQNAATAQCVGKAGSAPSDTVLCSRHKQADLFLEIPLDGHVFVELTRKWPFAATSSAARESGSRARALVRGLRGSTNPRVCNVSKASLLLSLHFHRTSAVWR